MRLPLSTLLLAFIFLSLCACGTRNIKPGEIPKANEGIAFVRIILNGAPSAMVHLFTKGDRMGPHKARVDAIEGDHVYAVIMAQGEYDIGQISADGRSGIWPDSSLCPAFKVMEGKTNYTGTLALTFEPSKWFALSRKYQIRCSNSADEEAEAFNMFINTYGKQNSTRR